MPVTLELPSYDAMFSQRLVGRAWVVAAPETQCGQACPWQDYEVKGCKTSAGQGAFEDHPLPSFERRAKHVLGGQSALLSPGNVDGKRLYVVSVPPSCHLG